jgi:hypothetical protein
MFIQPKLHDLVGLKMTCFDRDRLKENQMSFMQRIIPLIFCISIRLDADC